MAISNVTDAHFCQLPPEKEDADYGNSYLLLLAYC